MGKAKKFTQNNWFGMTQLLCDVFVCHCLQVLMPDEGFVKNEGRSELKGCCGKTSINVDFSLNCLDMLNL